jgi:fatty-acyl-CoA synthase
MTSRAQILATEVIMTQTTSSPARLPEGLPTRPLSPSTRFWPAGHPYSLDVPQVSLYEHLEVSARRYPEKVALRYYGREVRYQQLLEEARRLSGHLATMGMKAGDRVVLSLQNSPHWAAAAYAVWRLGGIVVPLAPMLGEAEYRYFLEDSGAHLAVVGAEQYAPLKAAGLRHAVMADLTTGTTLPPTAVLDSTLQAGGGDTTWTTAMTASIPAAPRVQPGELAALIYTSGTTGKPKGAMHSHASISANVVGSALMRSASSADVSLMTLPLFHVSAFVHDLLMTVYLGASVVMLSRWDRQLAREAMQTQGVTMWFAITTLVVDLLGLPDLNVNDVKTLRLICGGGAAMPEALGLRLREMTGLTFVEGYGLTETISQSHFNPVTRPKLQCLGLPVYDVDSRIVDPETHRELGTGEAGEIVTHGPQVFLGYWNNPQATQDAFLMLGDRRYFRTGDLAYTDEEGYFFFVDRLKRMVNVSGMKVWPAEVEAVLHGHPAVQEACVIAVPDPRTGERVRAVVVLRPGQDVSESDVIAWARGEMAHYKAPREVVFVPALLRGNTGKVLWRQMQEDARQQAADQAAHPMD